MHYECRIKQGRIRARAKKGPPRVAGSSPWMPLVSRFGIMAAVCFQIVDSGVGIFVRAAIIENSVCFGGNDAASRPFAGKGPCPFCVRSNLSKRLWNISGNVNLGRVGLVCNWVAGDVFAGVYIYYVSDPFLILSILRNFRLIRSSLIFNEFEWNFCIMNVFVRYQSRFSNEISDLRLDNFGCDEFLLIAVHLRLL